MTEIKYLLMPQWRFEHNGEPDFDIPPYFLKLFSSKKEIEEYLSSNNLEMELNHVKDKAFADRVEFLHLTGEERTKELAKMFNYSRVTFWVIGINPVGKGNRIGLMERCYGKKGKKRKWKYVSYFGGKVWKDQLMFGIYR